MISFFPLVYFLIGEPVEVTVEIKVVSFGELNEANMVQNIIFVGVRCKAQTQLFN